MVDTISNITTEFRFKSTFALESDLQYMAKIPGDVVYCKSTGKTFVCDGKGWILIADENSKELENQDKEKIKYLHDMKCECCGAPLNDYDSTHKICEYCGSIYEYK